MLVDPCLDGRVMNIGLLALHTGDNVSHARFPGNKCTGSDKNAEHIDHNYVIYFAETPLDFAFELSTRLTVQT